MKCLSKTNEVLRVEKEADFCCCFFFVTCGVKYEHRWMGEVEGEGGCYLVRGEKVRLMKRLQAPDVQFAE